jgi:hypothetical protein
MKLPVIAMKFFFFVCVCLHRITAVHSSLKAIFCSLKEGEMYTQTTQVVEHSNSNMS